MPVKNPNEAIIGNAAIKSTSHQGPLKYDNRKIIGLDKAYKDIFSSKNLHENLSKINGEFKDNELVSEVIKFIEKDKKRPICSPQN